MGCAIQRFKSMNNVKNFLYHLTLILVNIEISDHKIIKSPIKVLNMIVIIMQNNTVYYASCLLMQIEINKGIDRAVILPVPFV